MELDKFKSVNDVYGHKAGDVVLQNSIAVCKKYVNDDFIIGRYGGEEFVILMGNVSSEEAFNTIEEIRISIMN